MVNADVEKCFGMKRDTVMESLSAQTPPRPIDRTMGDAVQLERMKNLKRFRNLVTLLNPTVTRST